MLPTVISFHASDNCFKDLITQCKVFVEFINEPSHMIMVLNTEADDGLLRQA